MASSSSASATANLTAALGAPPTEKLTRQNHLFWKAQVLPALRGAQVMELLDGSDEAPPKTLEVEDTNNKKTTVPNSAYGVWLARDQAVLSFLVKGLDQDLLSQHRGLVLMIFAVMEAGTAMREATAMEVATVVDVTITVVTTVAMTVDNTVIAVTIVGIDVMTVEVASTGVMMDNAVMVEVAVVVMIVVHRREAVAEEELLHALLTQPAKSALRAYGVDTNWYMDTGATDHITGQLNKLHTQDNYKGHDQVHNASGTDTDTQHNSPGADPHADPATEPSLGSESSSSSAPDRTTGATSRPVSVVADTAGDRTGASSDGLGGRTPSSGARSPSLSSRGAPRSAATESSSDSDAAAVSFDPAHGSSVAAPAAAAPETHQYRTRLQQGEPNNLTEALEDTNWKHAMDEEYTALMDNKKWHLVPPSSNKNLIDCKWVYRVKKRADGTIERYKARLVAKGFKQRTYGLEASRQDALLPRNPNHGSVEHHDAHGVRNGLANYTHGLAAIINGEWSVDVTVQHLKLLATMVQVVATEGPDEFGWK
ncbi:hypothetical protein QYE76_013245 [Lolium multiflorum]|uniref:Reverse transcriptase Ty1/copia-type domain-containing protein n=1 Tax=Lolium multiflorum TaxID=4521 RepID=A0AAD8U260_LOLMU|nr:hypothetical protein QYE76_013245 [Lolium multiflorum]